jgi:hypothetical protein
LLAVFGTILRYGDLSGTAPAGIEGIVIIDELDAHMHIDLQIKAIPELIATFPRIQFIISSHSPFFALGMEKKYSNDQVRIVELPEGNLKTAEAYEEFAHGVAAFRETETFEAEVKKMLQAGETPLILVGGKTDVEYFNAAARLLNYPALVGVFESVGKDDSKGDRNSGDCNITNAVHFLQANPGITRRRIAAVYDCDAKKLAQADDRVYVHKLGHVPGRKMKKGIENLIPDDAFTPAMYDEKAVDGDYGDDFVKPVFNKVRASSMLCGEAACAQHFEDFRPVLEELRSILIGPAGPNVAQTRGAVPSPSL